MASPVRSRWATRAWATVPVASVGERTTKRAADQAGRAGDGDALRHGVLLMQATSGLELALFEPGLHRAEEPSGVGPVDDAVVVGQREVHHRADRDGLAAVGVGDDDGPLDDRAGAEDGDLRLVDDRGVEERAAAAGVGDGEG